MKKRKEIKTDFDSFISTYLSSEECLDLSTSSELSKKIEYYNKRKKGQDLYEERMRIKYGVCLRTRGLNCARLMRKSGEVKQCAVCGFDIIVEIHHIKSMKDGGKDRIENLIYLCPNHHKMVHKGLIYVRKTKDL